MHPGFYFLDIINFNKHDNCSCLLTLNYIIVFVGSHQQMFFLYNFSITGSNFTVIDMAFRTKFDMFRCFTHHSLIGVGFLCVYSFIFFHIFKGCVHPATLAAIVFFRAVYELLLAEWHQFPSISECLTLQCSSLKDYILSSIENKLMSC